MTYEQWQKLYPECRYAAGLCSYKTHIPGARIIVTGMLEFTADSAYNLAEPFDGNCGAISLIDCSNAVIYVNGKYCNMLDINDEHEALKKAKIERGFYGGTYEPPNDRPTKLLPFALKIYGNDDSSYSKFYATEQEALSDFVLLEACQPIDFKEIYGFGFIFTN